MNNRERVEAMRSLNRVTKWRTLLAGWQLGTRTVGDPECDAVRDHRELSILLRVEVTALAGLLLDKGIITDDELTYQMGLEADHLDAGFRDRFPGVKATDNGLDIDIHRVKGWMKEWRS